MRLPARAARRHGLSHRRWARRGETSRPGGAQAGCEPDQSDGQRRRDVADEPFAAVQYSLAEISTAVLATQAVGTYVLAHAYTAEAVQICPEPG